jgi:hypothetical protein
MYIIKKSSISKSAGGLLNLKESFNANVGIFFTKDICGREKRLTGAIQSFDWSDMTETLPKSHIAERKRKK